MREALGRTLGVLVFQEQVMQISTLAAGFTAGEADGLRRAMAAWKRKGGLDRYYAKIVDGMIERGYTKEFAEAIFQQIHGFSGYGFPESHAASFALLVYASCWIKRHHPAEFLAAMINYVLATLLEEVLVATTLRLQVMSRGRYEMPPSHRRT